jgi:hypothetical protein
MPKRARKSSACVTLVLIGAAALSSCNVDNSAQSRRRQYATKEACLADWGDPRECDEVVTRRPDGSRSSFYWGGGHGYGSYRGGSSGSSYGSSGRSVSRGGFGSSGHAHSSGS